MWSTINALKLQGNINYDRRFLLSNEMGRESSLNNPSSHLNLGHLQLV